MSNFFFKKKIFKTLLVLILTQISSCARFYNFQDPNEKFVSNYKDEVKKINQERSLLSKPQEKEIRKTDPEYNRWRDSAYVIGVAGTSSLQSAFIDTYKIKPPKPPEESLPNIETFNSGKNSNAELPKDVFVVSYSNENYPDSYRNAGVSFDDIRIPARDAFGIETALGEKNFTLVDRKTLQKNIDYVRASLKSDDKEIITILVHEQKEIKSKKRLGKKNPKITDKKADEETNEENSEEANEKINEKNDELEANNLDNKEKSKIKNSDEKSEAINANADINNSSSDQSPS